jgi:pimeloyl-ACP methyl ester carboxylesterase
MSEREMPVWERRFWAPEIGMPSWARSMPGRLVYASTESGVWQLHTLDRASGERRRVTDHPVGVMGGDLTLDGEGVLWFEDENGDESGRWFVEPFAGGERRPFLDGVPHGWNEGLAQAPGVVAAAVSGRDGFTVYVATEGGPAREVYRHAEAVRLGGAEDGQSGRAGLSADGALLCLEHSEHGDLIHPALRVVSSRSGEVVGEQHDEGMALVPACWSPVPGDQRLAIVHEGEGEERPAVWDLSTGDRHDLSAGLQGAVRVADWWPDGSALLLDELREGRNWLFRYDLSTDRHSPIPAPEGTIFAARVRPDGSVWVLRSRGEAEWRILDSAGEEVLRPAGDRPPPGRHYVSWHFENPQGQRVHGFQVTPEGQGPFPVIMRVHGGPTWLDADRWSPEVQAYVDAGFAVGLVNYRGSTGYGRAWRDTLIGDVGGPELEDVNAGLADLVRRGIADPDRAVIAGWSWGGYVTLLELGKHPELWRCGFAGVPVGDYEASYDDSSPLLQAYDRALLGGTPWEVPELMRDRNPINFAGGVRAPVLVIAGENDSRCPIRQVMNYVERLRLRGHPHELYLYGTGHGSNDISEQVRQQRLILEFLAKHVPGVRRP